MELAPIASVTDRGEALRLCFASVLASRCVFEMKRFERRKEVRYLAIFAATARAIPGQAPQRTTHCSSVRSPTSLSAFKRSVEIMSLTSMKRSYSSASSGASCPSWPFAPRHPVALAPPRRAAIHSEHVRCSYRDSAQRTRAGYRQHPKSLFPRT